jgi:hypothetical protein
VVRLIRQEFVPLAIDGRLRNYNDAEAEFLRGCDCGGQGRVDIVTAGGKRVGYPELNSKGYLLTLEKALKAWAALPESERKPGAVQVPDRGPIDPKRAGLIPPAGCLIVRVINRQLERDGKGELRHTVPEDYLPHLSDPKIMGTANATALWIQPANDYMWVTQAEWQTMMPANPRKGQVVKVPTSLCERIFRYHLDPSRGMAEGDSFAHVNAGVGELKLTVEVVSDGEVRLRLDGYAKLHNPRTGLLTYKSPGTERSKSQIPLDYEPRLLGYLAYDPAKKVFTRFDMVALGEVRGRPVGANLLGERLGAANPLGIAFELVAEPTPADYLNPQGARNARRYLGLAK